MGKVKYTSGMSLTGRARGLTKRERVAILELQLAMRKTKPATQGSAGPPKPRA